MSIFNSGTIFVVLALAVPLALIISLLLQRLYLRNVRRSMMAAKGAALDSDEAESEGTRPATLGPLAFVDQPATLAFGRSAAETERRRAAAVYAAGALVYATAMAVFYILSIGVDDLLNVRTVHFIALFLFPLIPTLAITITLSWKELLSLIGGYFGLLVVINLWRLHVGGELQTSVLLFAGLNLPILVLGIVFLLPRVRTTGPLILILCIAAIAGGLTANTLLWGDNPARIAWLTGIAGKFGMNGRQLFYTIAAIGALALGVVGWFVMRGVGALYRRRLISDQSMLVDAVWLIYSICQCLLMGHLGFVRSLTPFLAFALGRLTTTLGFAYLRSRRNAEERVPHLLLLRVFSLGKRSGRLFNKVSRLWRYRGGIYLIAGPDLATTTVEPHEFLDFLSGRLSRRFIGDIPSFDRRLSEVDERLDLDGRYRVGDFFCHDNAWRAALSRLVRHADVIMMDLRGFRPEHQGCVFEIREIVNRVPFRRVVFVVDETTDEAFLRGTFAAAWDDVPASSPNIAGTHDVTLFRLGDGPARDVKALVRNLEAISRDGQ